MVGAISVSRASWAGGWQAPLIIDGHIILNLGYAFAGKMPGNALLVLSVTSPVTASR